MAEYLPRVGEKCYYMHKEVIVIDVLDCFHLVKIKDLKKKFKNHIVFDHLNLSIANHQITTIYGESGSGKSTLLNIIGLLERSDGGSITLFHEESPKVGSKKAREFLQNHISYLF